MYLSLLTQMWMFRQLELNSSEHEVYDWKTFDYNKHQNRQITCSWSESSFVAAENTRFSLVAFCRQVAGRASSLSFIGARSFESRIQIIRLCSGLKPFDVNLRMLPTHT